MKFSEVSEAIATAPVITIYRGDTGQVDVYKDSSRLRRLLRLDAGWKQGTIHRMYEFDVVKARWTLEGDQEPFEIESQKGRKALQEVLNDLLRPFHLDKNRPAIITMYRKGQRWIL